MTHYVHTIYHVNGETEVHDRQRGDDDPIALEISNEASAVSFQLPIGDEEAELFLSLLTAAIDNAASRVKLRRQKHEREVPGETVVGWNGAGASVEAARG